MMMNNEELEKRIFDLEVSVVDLIVKFKTLTVVNNKSENKKLHVFWDNGRENLFRIGELAYREFEKVYAKNYYGDYICPDICFDYCMPLSEWIEKHKGNIF